MAARKPLSELSPAYRKRVERAEARGKTRAEARGHRTESAEKKRRRARYRAEFGASPEKMGKLRTLMRRKLLSGEGYRDGGSKGHVDTETVLAGIMKMTREMMEDMLHAGPDQLRELARLTYQEFILVYPDFDDARERNPFWYHPG